MKGKAVIEVSIIARLLGPVLGSFIARVDDPEEEESLRAIQASAILRDLAMNDEIISGYDPENVAEAYNEICALNPHISLRPAALRSILRKRLAAGVLDTNEVCDAVVTGGELQEQHLDRLRFANEREPGLGSYGQPCN